MRHLFKKISDWEKYERLHHYPELKEFPRDEALRRLDHYEQKTIRPGEKERGRFLILVTVLAWTVFCIAMGIWSLPAWFFPGYIVVGMLWYVRYRRLRTRVRATIAAEKAEGRFDRCLACGYDLRGSGGEVCPECGEGILATTPPNDSS